MAYISAALYVYMVTGGAMVSWCLCVCVRTGSYSHRMRLGGNALVFLTIDCLSHVLHMVQFVLHACMY